MDREYLSVLTDPDFWDDTLHDAHNQDPEIDIADLPYYLADAASAVIEEAENKAGEPFFLGEGEVGPVKLSRLIALNKEALSNEQIHQLITARVGDAVVLGPGGAFATTTFTRIA